MGSWFHVRGAAVENAPVSKILSRRCELANLCHINRRVRFFETQCKSHRLECIVDMRGEVGAD